MTIAEGARNREATADKRVTVVTVMTVMTDVLKGVVPTRGGECDRNKTCVG